MQKQTLRDRFLALHKKAGAPVTCEHLNSLVSWYSKPRVIDLPGPRRRYPMGREPVQIHSGSPTPTLIVAILAWARIYNHYAYLAPVMERYLTSIAGTVPVCIVPQAKTRLDVSGGQLADIQANRAKPNDVGFVNFAWRVEKTYRKRRSAPLSQGQKPKDPHKTALFGGNLSNQESIKAAHDSRASKTAIRRRIKADKTLYPKE